MSEPDKPAEAEVTVATNGSGPPEDTGNVAVTGKSHQKENGLKTGGVAEGERKHLKEEVDVKMEEVTGVNGGEKYESREGMERREPIKVEVQEKETEEGKPMKMKVEEKEIEENEPMKVEVEEKETKENNAGQVTEERVEEDEEKGEDAEDNGREGKKEQAEELDEDKGTRKKRPRRRKAVGKVDMKEKEGGEDKDVLRTPVASSVDRPVRERKTVERLVASLEKGPAKGFVVEKGRGTPLKDIPNVAYKLSKRKPDDVRLVHMLLFGRKGKAVHFKSHIFQFSGFVWHENEDKQRAKVKEKLDKCVKDKLLDLCNVFDIPASKATSRKEDLVAKLLDFMVSPHATTDVILAEKEQSTKSRKRKRVSRGSVLKRSAGHPARYSGKKWKNESASNSEKSDNETEDEDEDRREEGNVDSLPDEDVAMKHPKSEKDDESEHEDGADEKEEYLGKGTEKSSKPQGSSRMAKSKNVSTTKKGYPTGSTKSPTKTSLSPAKKSPKRINADEDKYAHKKGFSRKRKDDMIPKKRMSSSKENVKEKKATGKKGGRAAKESSPTDEELRNSICEILKEVDFNTATFTDILKKLAFHYHMDLTARKASIKLMIQDELTRLAEEAEDEDDGDEDEEEAGDENLLSAGKEVEA